MRIHSRWNNTNGALYTYTGFGDRQLGFGYSYNEIRLCILPQAIQFSGLNGGSAAATISGRHA